MNSQTAWTLPSYQKMTLTSVPSLVVVGAVHRPPTPLKSPNPPNQKNPHQPHPRHSPLCHQSKWRCQWKALSLRKKTCLKHLHRNRKRLASLLSRHNLSRKAYLSLISQPSFLMVVSKSLLRMVPKPLTNCAFLRWTTFKN